MTEIPSFTHRVLTSHTYPGGYTLLRVATDRAAGLQPGHALRINGHRWPVLQTAPQQGWVDCLQSCTASLQAGDAIDLAGPLGEPFEISATTARALLLAGPGGIASIVFLARMLRNHQPRVKPLVLLDLKTPFPFQPHPSRIITPGLPASVIATLPLLEDWRIPGRIACQAADQPGCFEGTVTDLAHGWLETAQGVADVTLFACGDDPLLQAVEQLAQRWRLACQVRTAQLF